MNCALHTDTPAVAYCRTCGKALCEQCKRDVLGAIYCEPCLAARLQGAPQPQVQPAAAVHYVPVPDAPNPGIAAALGLLIPGVGAMYNGQFAKALVHVGIFVALIMASDKIAGEFGILIAFFVFYMGFDAFQTAKARQMGQPPPDPLGINRMFGIQEPPPSHPKPVVVAAQPGTVAGQQNVIVAPAVQPVAAPPADNSPTGAIVLISLGAIFLLANFGFFHVGRLWPLFLIGIGLWIAYKRTATRG
jgi:TM2 domain-containing membrane protein YozV